MGGGSRLKRLLPFFSSDLKLEQQQNDFCRGSRYIGCEHCGRDFSPDALKSGT
ncbi:hypothetical protein NB705_001204 [Xanthomonas sacchari]|nr:hypothetical protein [Xanthomonas sacchari]